MYNSRVASLYKTCCRRLGGWRRLQASRCFTTLQQQADDVHLIDALLKDRIESGELHFDHAQERAARRLTRLQEALVGYTNEPLIQWNKEEEERRRLESQKDFEDKDQIDNVETIERQEGSGVPVDEKEHDDEDDPPNRPQFIVPRGLFLYGNVGTGKSMLMDAFYKQAPVNRKQRVHFHAFMQHVHHLIFQFKQEDLIKKGRNFSVDTTMENNPVYRVAQQLSKQVELLCFDEFQVTDVADALILRQLFEVLFGNGTVVVATSNRPPSDLYEGGINRSYFMPFIDLLHQQCIVYELKSNTDYRQVMSQDLRDFYLVDNSKDFYKSTQVCNETFEKLLNGREATCMDLSVGFNRSLTVRQADPNGVVVRFDFTELCDNHLGSGDYRAVANNFDVILLEHIPLLTLKEHDQARRFITLVDELYEHKCALMCSAVALPEELFLDYNGETILEQKDENSIETKVEEMFGIDVAQGSGKTAGELASVKELPFAFRRASSRLTEMCSRPWWEKVL